VQQFSPLRPSRPPSDSLVVQWQQAQAELSQQWQAQVQVSPESAPRFVVALRPQAVS